MCIYIYIYIYICIHISMYTCIVITNGITNNHVYR